MVGLSEKWSTLVFRGVLAMAFGIVTFALPQLTFLALLILFGIWAAADGVASLVGAVQGRAEHRLWLALYGASGLAAAAVTFLWPGMTALVLLYVIAFWAIVHGAFLVVAWWTSRQNVSDAWVLGLDGIVAIVFGILLLASPGIGAFALAFMVGTYAIVIGAALIGLGFTLRGLSHPAIRP